MKSLLVCFAVSVLTIIAFACGNNTSFKKTPGGMPYKIFHNKKNTQQVKPGDILKLWVTQKINDSVVISANKGIPLYIPVDNQTNRKYDVSELWTSLYSGDSLVTVQMMDTFMNRAPQSVPPQYKRGDKVTTLIKVLGIFSSDSLARLDEEKTRMEYLATEVKEMEKWLADNKIRAEKTPSGAFVQILQPGTGNLIDSGKYVTINYTGTSWSGTKFDSNTDTAFHHPQPYTFMAGARQMIKGFDEAMFLLRKGSVAKVYIPSILGYGPSTDRPGIKAFEHLKFDLQILDVQNNAPEQPAQKKVDAPQ